MPRWRNGRRKRLKISRGLPRAGSSPALGTRASIAQLVEQLPLKEMVVGSIPTGGTDYKKDIKK